jgi:polyisoprenoid-binding protein YceI
MSPVFVLALLAATGAQTFTVDAEKSRVVVQVGKAGVFGFAGHEHEVLAPVREGRIVADPGDLSRSSVTVAFQAASLKVTGAGEPAADVPKVQETMQGPKVLESARFPEIAFRSQKVSGRGAGTAWELQVTGDLTVHGVTRSVTLPMKVEIVGDVLTATGRTTLRHDWFGLQPVSAGGGTVKVKNELGVDLRIVARAGGEATP